jgi:hypothetical protein
MSKKSVRLKNKIARDKKMEEFFGRPRTDQSSWTRLQRGTAVDNPTAVQGGIPGLGKRK